MRKPSSSLTVECPFCGKSCLYYNITATIRCNKCESFVPINGTSCVTEALIAYPSMLECHSATFDIKDVYPLQSCIAVDLADNSSDLNSVFITSGRTSNSRAYKDTRSVELIKDMMKGLGYL